MPNDQDVLEITAQLSRGSEDRATSPSEPDGAGDRREHPAPLDATAAVADNVPYEPSPEITQAMLAAARGQQLVDRLAALQNDAVKNYTGISRSELGLRVWNAPMAAVATRLGLKKHVLMRICKLYEVPTPPKGYFNTSFANRPIRWTRVAVGADT